MQNQASGRVAVRVIRPELTNDHKRDESEMRQLGVALGYAVDDTVVTIDPSRQGPYVTVMEAIARARADAVIVPDLEHVDGLDRWIRERAELITVAGERVLTHTTPMSAATA